jgi:hypothetical protein
MDERDVYVFQNGSLAINSNQEFSSPPIPSCSNQHAMTANCSKLCCELLKIILIKSACISTVQQSLHAYHLIESSILIIARRG